MEVLTKYVSCFGGMYIDRVGGYVFQVVSVLTELMGTCFRWRVH